MDFGYPTSTPRCSRPRCKRALVNTIGTFRPGDVLTTTPETLQLMIDVTLGPAPEAMTHAVAPEAIANVMRSSSARPRHR